MSMSVCLWGFILCCAAWTVQTAHIQTYFEEVPGDLFRFHFHFHGPHYNNANNDNDAEAKQQEQPPNVNVRELNDTVIANETVKTTNVTDDSVPVMLKTLDLNDTAALSTKSIQVAANETENSTTTTARSIRNPACDGVGMIIPIPTSRCQYLECVFLEEPWYNSSGNLAIATIVRDCPKGTALPEGYQNGIMAPCTAFLKDCSGVAANNTTGLKAGELMLPDHMEELEALAKGNNQTSSLLVDDPSSVNSTSVSNNTGESERSNSQTADDKEDNDDDAELTVTTELDAESVSTLQNMMLAAAASDMDAVDVDPDNQRLQHVFINMPKGLQDLLQDAIKKGQVDIVVEPVGGGDTEA